MKKFIEVAGCQDSSACNYNEMGDCSYHGSREDCEGKPLYCTDPEACNYNKMGDCSYHGSREDCAFPSSVEIHFISVSYVNSKCGKTTTASFPLSVIPATGRSTDEEFKASDHVDLRANIDAESLVGIEYTRAEYVSSSCQSVMFPCC